MAFRLVTGRAARDHVTSDDMGQLYALTKGDGRYRLTDLTCEVVDANTLRVSAGHLLIDGRHFRNSSEGETLSIASGAQGVSRVDLVALRYEYVTSGEDYVEQGSLVVITGTPTAGTPEAPTCAGGSILDGDQLVEVPLFTVPVNGISVGTPSACMLDEYELPAKYGGTGVAVELVATVRGAVEDATSAAEAARAAANAAMGSGPGGATQAELGQLAAVVAQLAGGYLVVGETVVVPPSKGGAAGGDVTLYSATYDEATGTVALT